MPSVKKLLINSLKAAQQVMEEGEEIPLVNIEDSSNKGYEVATYLTKGKIGCIRLPKKDSTGTYTIDERTSFSELGYEEFAQGVIALGKELQVANMLSQYSAAKRMGRT